LKVTKDYTQIIATTHSTHLSEVSDIRKVNILKAKDNITFSMQPSNGLDAFGQKKLNMGKLSLSDCVERYLDAKRSVLLFSKGVILVEGDGEEILIPNMIRESFGVTLDELGIGLVNVGSTAFEYVASLFSNKRIQRYCSIVTDEDVQIVDKSSSFYKSEAEVRGKSRKIKLGGLYGVNPWVKSFYAPHTLEVDFASVNEKANAKYIESILEFNYVDEVTISNHKAKLNGTDSECANTVLTLARAMGKGWYATVLSNKIDISVSIPEYILDAVAFACREIITIDILLKVVGHSLTGYNEKIAKPVQDLIRTAKTIEEKKMCITNFRKNFSGDVVEQFCNQLDKYLGSWCD
jgi:predicted ATP-dependent endonuclease of OLD family